MTDGGFGEGGTDALEGWWRLSDKIVVSNAPSTQEIVGGLTASPNDGRRYSVVVGDADDGVLDLVEVPVSTPLWVSFLVARREGEGRGG